jgi:hypothetical protein
VLAEADAGDTHEVLGERDAHHAVLVLHLHGGVVGGAAEQR